MKKSLKKIIGVFLACIMILSFVPLEGNRITVEAATQYSGTANGKSLSTIKTSTDKSGYCACGKAIGTAGHWCCWNYASNAYKSIWGSAFSRDNNNNLLKNVQPTDRKLTATNLKKYLQYAVPGANVRIDSSSSPTAGDNDGHSLIFCGMNSAGDGAYFLEGNWDGKGNTRLQDVKFSWLASNYSKYTYIKYIMWPKGGSVNMSAPAISNAKISQVKGGAALIECDVTAAKGVKEVQCTVWSETLGIDGYHWITVPISASNGHYMFTFNVASFGEQTGTYKVNIHAWDNEGTKTMTSSPLSCSIPLSTPNIYNQKITNVTDKGGTIEFDVYSKNGIKDVQCTVWNEVQGIDNYQWVTTPTSVSNGHYKFDFKVSNFGNRSGVYKANIHVWNTAGEKTTLLTALSCTVPTHTHTIVTDKAVAATCTTAGKTEGKHCSSCGTVTVAQQTIAAKGHSLVTDKAVAATCTTAGKTEGKHCSVCGAVTVAQQTVAAKGHSLVTDKAVAATCTTAGKTEGKHCSVCGVVTVAQQTVAAKEHIVVVDKAVAPTSTTAGKTEGSHCSVCGTVIKEQTVIPATGTPSSPTPSSPTTPSVSVSYHTHIQTLGDSQGTKSNGQMAGTSGMAKRLENIWIKVDGNPNLGIQYSTHCQTYGWLPWSANGEANGTSGEAKRLEAIKIQLTGADASKYDVYYRVHAQSYGWLGWAKNGEPSGTAGYAKRLEGIQVVIKKKGEAAPGLNYEGVNALSLAHDNRAYVAKTAGNITIPGSAVQPNVMYKTHVQSLGWQKWMVNGQMSGTSGMAKRLEGINVKVSNCPYAGGIRYMTHIQKYGWSQGWKYDGAMAGTSGEAKRLEAIKIELTGEMARHYDVYYRVHAQSYGWLAWAKNGAESGTAGYGKRLEGIQVVLVPKGQPAPANSYQGIMSVKQQAYFSK